MIANIESVGNGTNTLHYAYRPGLSRLETATWRNSQDAVLNSRTYAYDAYHRLTGINLNNASEVAYTLNDKDQRTAASYAVGGAWSYVTAQRSPSGFEISSVLCFSQPRTIGG
jgi:rhs family protein-like protein